MAPPGATRARSLQGVARRHRPHGPATLPGDRSMKRSLRHLMGVAAVLLTACGGGNDSADSSARESPMAAAKTATSATTAQRLALPGGATSGVVDARLSKLRGKVDVWVSLDSASVAAYKSARLEAQGVASQQARALGTTAR